MSPTTKETSNDRLDAAPVKGVMGALLLPLPPAGAALLPAPGAPAAGADPAASGEDSPPEAGAEPPEAGAEEPLDSGDDSPPAGELPDSGDEAGEPAPPAGAAAGPAPSDDPPELGGLLAPVLAGDAAGPDAAGAGIGVVTVANNGVGPQTPQVTVVTVKPCGT